MGQTLRSDLNDPAVPVYQMIVRAQGVTGLTVALRIATGAPGEFLDFDDLTFKTAAHTTPTLDVPEVDATDLPGLYAIDGGFDVSSIVNMPAGQASLFFHYGITAGGEVGDDVDLVQFFDRPVDLFLDEVNTGATHNVKDSVGKQIRQGATGGADVEPEDVVSATPTTITLAAIESAVDEFLARRYIAIVSGLGAGQVRIIDSYVGATKVATVGRAWTTNPDATSEYLLLLSSEGDLSTKDEDRLRKTTKVLGQISGQPTTHTNAIVGTPGAITTPDAEIDVTVTQVDATTATFSQA